MRACHRGHALTPDNVYRAPDGFGSCRACRNEHKRKDRIAKRAKRKVEKENAFQDALQAFGATQCKRGHKLEYDVSAHLERGKVICRQCRADNAVKRSRRRPLNTEEVERLRQLIGFKSTWMTEKDEDE
jgi:hypothetical protein